MSSANLCLLAWDNFNVLSGSKGVEKGEGGCGSMPAWGSTRRPGENPLLTQCEPPLKYPDDFAPGQRVTRT